MPKNVDDWRKLVDELVSVFAEVEGRSLSLPTFSMAPFGIYLWAFLKFELCFLVDVFYFIPVNTVILLRNVLPGRWAYRSFSGSYIKQMAKWLWSGELPIVSIVAMRSLTQALLRNHFHRRFQQVRRAVLVQGNLPKAQETELLTALEKVLLRWPPWGFQRNLFNYGLPILSPLVGLYQLVLPGKPPAWTGLVIVMSLAWALAFLASSFMIKRGLLLGGTGRSAYFPGFLEGRGAYASEERLLANFGIPQKEFPLGFVLSLILIPVNLLVAVSSYESGLYELLLFGQEDPFGKIGYLAQSMAGPVIFAILGSVALARRNRLGRS